MPPSTTDEQDAEDMSRLANGHPAALDALMERHAQKLFQYLVRSLQNQDDAEDLAQQTFVRVYQNRAKFEQGQKFKPWLYAIASNLVRDRYRWRSRHPQVSIDAEHKEPDSDLDLPIKETLVGPEAGPDEILEKQERANTVKAAVTNLPEELRTPLILAFYEGLSQAEIGTILKCSVKAVETRIYRARKSLRETLRPMLHVA
jgi:RNA polymerase sigma-70 factor (ECF subfamily)